MRGEGREGNASVWVVITVSASRVGVRMMDLHVKYLDTPSEASFPRPIFRIAVL